MPQSSDRLTKLQQDLLQLVDRLPSLAHGDLIQTALEVLVRMAGEELDRLDFKILRSTLRDLELGFQAFHPFRHTRKISIFGSSRLPPDSPEYQLAIDFARCVTEEGFMVMTGAGGGIMEAGNLGAGHGKSFGLNIELPFEQGANPYIEGDAKLVNFKYFFTRKLFFLRESDAIALFPGGFGTLDEAFECLTLSQTGKSPPIPVVLVDHPGGTYWQAWDSHVQQYLIKQGLISPEDDALYTITDDIHVACEAIKGFYRNYHSSRYVDDRLIIRMKQALSPASLAQLNHDFQDIILTGEIEPVQACLAEVQQDQPQPQQTAEDVADLPRIAFHFNQRDHGRLYQMIAAINQMGIAETTTSHPEQK